MWPFKPKVTVYRQKYIDWSKVSTVGDIVNILTSLGITTEIRVVESEWDNPKIKHLLGDRITRKTFVNGHFSKSEEE